MVTVAALAVLLWGLGFVVWGLLLAMWSMWRRQRIERASPSVACRRIGSGLLALAGGALIAVTITPPIIPRSLIVKLTDDKGRVDYDFAVVHVYDKAKQEVVPPTMHAAFWPSQGLCAGDEVIFKARAFVIGHKEGRETWDFGDGSTSTQVNPVHTYFSTSSRWPRAYRASLAVTDDKGVTSTARATIIVLPTRSR